jgi:phosphatidylethanolamine-binding protein (PEBP) family uncharacterized protein
MHPVKSSRSALTVLGLAVALGGFGCTSSDGGSGTGGAPGTGGQSTGTGGSGTGGEHATGGSPGTGGTATGGLTGTGGTATGGVTGTGGTATGGVTGTGGTPATGGSGGHATGGVGGGGAGHAGGGANGTGGTAGATGGGGSSGSNFSLVSNVQADGAHFASKYTCQESPPLSGKSVGGLGNGINPDLEWMNPPAGTMSFAITFLDTTLINAGGSNIPLGEHWGIWNIPATTMSLPEGLTGTLSGALATAKQSGTFLAPCAQNLMNNMDDQYEFTVYALSTTTLTLPTGSGTAIHNERTALMTAMTANQVLGTAVLKGHAGKNGM